MDVGLENQRLDKWLWSSRFFKTRGLASEAVSGGKVHLNGDRVKPSRLIKPGDHLRITRDAMVYEITVLALNNQRRPAKEAQLLYQETDEGRLARLKQIEDNRILNAQMPHSSHKPNKKERRRIIRFIRKPE